MAKRKGKSKFSVCDTCGAIGYLKELIICCHCKNTFRHGYCMANMHFVTMPWQCDDCSQSLNVVQEEEEIIFDNKHFDAEDNNRVKTLLPSGNENQVMENKLSSKVPINSAKNDKQNCTGVSDTALPSQSMTSSPNPKKEKLANCHDQPCWKGTFEIFDGNLVLPPYKGVRAHLSCDVNPKVVNFCKSLSEKVELKELPLSKVWPKIFDSEPPNTDDVALYFFCDTGRPREKYIRLVQRLDSRDHALKAKMKGAQLLIFSSKKLHANSQKTKEVSYLWGIIRFSKPKGIVKDTNVKNTISTPKQKKQIRFDLSNLPPEKRSADININAEKNVFKSCLVEGACLDQSENTTKSVAKVISLGKQENEADSVFVGVDTEFDKVDYRTNEVDPDLPPGFSYSVPLIPQMNVQLQFDSGKINILKNKDVIDKVTNISLDPDIPPGFSYPSSAFLTSSLTNTSDNLTNVSVDTDIPPVFSYPSSSFAESSLANTVDNHTDEEFPGFPLLIKPEEVDENSDMSIDSEDEKSNMSTTNEGEKREDSNMPVGNEDEKTNGIMSFNLPNIGPPPGFPEMPIKLAKCIGGSEMNNCFTKTEEYIESISMPPGCTKIAVNHPFALPLECCECLRGVKNGSYAVESDEKVDKGSIKRATCTEDINFVKPNFVQSPKNKGATSTMIKCQNASIACAKTSDSENTSGGNPNSRSPVSSNKENTFISLNSAEECNKSRFTMENGNNSSDNSLSWVNKTIKIDVSNDAENGIFRSNAKAQSENSGKVSRKNMFGVNFSLQKFYKPSGPVVPFFLEDSSYTVSGSIPSNSLRKTHVSDTCEDGLVGHTKGNCATRDKRGN